MTIPIQRNGPSRWHGLSRHLICTTLVVLGLCWTLNAQSAWAGEAQQYVKAGSPAAGLSSCVAPTPFMRRNHMELIKHQRDTTVRHGIRDTRYNLAACIECHVSIGHDGRPVAVNAEHQFCQACHAFAAVKVDCFDCHTGVPKGGPLSGAAQSALDAARGDDRQMPGSGQEQTRPRGDSQ
jgi:hypothetical protein